jgi:hypothetical protein
MSMQLCMMSSGTELSAGVFGQHVHPILIPVILFLLCCLEDKVYNSNSRTEELKENICREIVNIPAEQLQVVNWNLFRQCEECLRVEGQQISTPPGICKLHLFHSEVIRQQAY